jgi:L-lysine 2,3-aminomutase
MCGNGTTAVTHEFRLTAQKNLDNTGRWAQIDLKLPNLVRIQILGPCPSGYQPGKASCPILHELIIENETLLHLMEANTRAMRKKKTSLIKEALHQYYQIALIEWD